MLPVSRSTSSTDLHSTVLLNSLPSFNLMHRYGLGGSSSMLAHKTMPTRLCRSSVTCEVG